MRIYLAGRYSRREEFCRYREELEKEGHKVTSRWLNGGHQVDERGMQIGDDGEAAVEALTEAASRFAEEDLNDVREAHLVVCFTEEPRKPHTNRGGRHVEMGYALGRGIPVAVVGHRENVFSWLRSVTYWPTWEDFRREVNLI